MQAIPTPPAAEWMRMDCGLFVSSILGMSRAESSCALTFALLDVAKVEHGIHGGHVNQRNGAGILKRTISSWTEKQSVG